MPCCPTALTGMCRQISLLRVELSVSCHIIRKCHTIFTFFLTDCVMTDQHATLVKLPMSRSEDCAHCSPGRCIGYHQSEHVTTIMTASRYEASTRIPAQCGVSAKTALTRIRTQALPMKSFTQVARPGGHWHNTFEVSSHGHDNAFGLTSHASCVQPIE